MKRYRIKQTKNGHYICQVSFFFNFIWFKMNDDLFHDMRAAENELIRFLSQPKVKYLGTEKEIVSNAIQKSLSKC